MPYGTMEKKRAHRRILKARRRAWFASIKEGLACRECGQSHPATLQFHHVDPSSKREKISTMVNQNRSKEDILAEIAKCDILCANCHAILHYEERETK